MKTHRPTIVLLLLGLLLAATLPRALPARAVEPTPDGTWTALPPLQTARTSHTATTLADGRVLVAGAGSSEVFDPATGRWSDPTPTGLSYAHTATLLPDGQVLATGAFAGGRGVLPGDANRVGRRTERYDPATDRWREATPMQTPRAFHTATALPDGRVLVAGGDTFTEGGATATAELYDPATDRWRPAGAMRVRRLSPTATLLRDGRVLVVGGDVVEESAPDAPSTAELYDPASDTWTTVAPLTTAQGGHAAALLPDGRVLVSGGGVPAGPGRAERATATAALFNPSTGTWAPAAPLPAARLGHAATTLPSGRVLVTGGVAGVEPAATAALYDPARDTWTPIESPAELRNQRGGLLARGTLLLGQRAALLTDGRVLLVGGGEGERAAGLYAEAALPAWCPAQTGQCLRGRFLEYWRQHGGLAVNGFPLSFAFTQRLEDGREYTVQYFERVRLELHPENPAPYDVLLGQFGRRILAGVPDAPTAPASPRPDATHFPETGHNVGPRFLAYWRANGGLAQFGYPLTEEFEQRLEDGKTYRVQYFERARFEYHPENPAPYDVLLGQFGRTILGTTGGPNLP